MGKRAARFFCERVSPFSTKKPDVQRKLAKRVENFSWKNNYVNEMLGVGAWKTDI